MSARFTTYSAQNNNCQTFIHAFLSSNGLDTTETKSFVLQDTEHLFENNPRFRKIVNTITDTAGLNNRINQLPIVKAVVQPRTIPQSDFAKTTIEKIKRIVKLPFYNF